MVSRPLPHAVLAWQDLREGAEVYPVPSLWEACGVSETQTYQWIQYFRGIWAL